MNDLRQLLDTAAHAPHAPAAPADDDLARGRDALRRHRRRRGAVGVAGLAALAVIGVGGATALDGPGTDGDRRDSAGDTGVAAPPSPTPRSAAPREPSPTASEPLRYQARTVDGRVVVGPYSFDAVPPGWEVQGGRPSFVTMVPRSGAPDRFIDSFEGKLVLMYEADGSRSGSRQTVGGREYVVRGDSGYTTVGTATRAGEPEGMVFVQCPDGALTVAEMIALLATVEVGPDAEG